MTSNRLLIHFVLSAAFLSMLIILSLHATQQETLVNLLARRNAPSTEFWFGTDNLGRDLWTRCLQGMMTSIQIGFTTAIISGGIALLMAVLSQINGVLRNAVSVLTDAMIALPHMLLQLLICFAFGGGKTGVIIAVALTHWPRLALILSAELSRIRQSDYILLAQRNGLSNWQCCYKHYLPQLLPQLIVGALLLFPHAVLHTAGLSFLGFGLSPHEPSLGLLLAEALRYISSGDWWLAVYPGLTLVVLVLAVDQVVRCLQKIWLGRTQCCN